MRSTDNGITEDYKTGHAALAGILLKSLEALAAAGEADAACRLAGHACAALRTTDADAWNKFNVLLHRLARHVR